MFRVGLVLQRLLLAFIAIYPRVFTALISMSSLDSPAKSEEYLAAEAAYRVAQKALNVAMQKRMKAERCERRLDSACLAALDKWLELK